MRKCIISCKKCLGSYDNFWRLLYPCNNTWWRRSYSAWIFQITHVLLEINFPKRQEIEHTPFLLMIVLQAACIIPSSLLNSSHKSGKNRRSRKKNWSQKIISFRWLVKYVALGRYFRYEYLYLFELFQLLSVNRFLPKYLLRLVCKYAINR